MQEDMRLKLPAASEPERATPPAEEATVQVLRTRGTLEERYRDAIMYEVKPGHCLVIDAVGLVNDAQPEAERAEVRIRLWDDGKGERGFVRFHPVPGTPLEIRPEEFVAKPDPEQVLDAYHRLSGGYADTTRANAIEAMRQALAGTRRAD